MKVAGCFRVVRRKDQFDHTSKPMSVRYGSLDIRILRWEKDTIPLLLVSASRKTGAAVDRNKFRRRVRMAFLAILRRCPLVIEKTFVLWVRPTRGNVVGCRIGYQDIEKQIESSLRALRQR